MTVALGFDQDVRANLPPGFGFLVPRSEGKRLLAATFVHNKFPHRAPEDRALLRCFLGGSRDEQVLQLTDENILNIVRDELRQILGLKAEPLFTRLYRWKGAMAQYTVGHLERLQRIERPGEAIAGAGVWRATPIAGLACPTACVRARRRCNRLLVVAPAFRRPSEGVLPSPVRAALHRRSALRP